MIVALFATMGSLHAQEKYAIIIGGNMNPGSSIPAVEQWNGGIGAHPIYGFDEFWNDAYLAWEMLVFDKDYADENVHVLFDDGDDYTFDNQDNRYKGIKHGIQYEVITDANTNKATIDDKFEELALTITVDDFLFVWIMSHGGSDANGYYFYSYDNQKIYASQLNTWLDGIAAHKKVVYLAFPKSGGFVQELEADGNIVIVACGPTEGASRADDLAHEIFLNIEPLNIEYRILK